MNIIIIVIQLIVLAFAVYGFVCIMDKFFGKRTVVEQTVDKYLQEQKNSILSTRDHMITFLKKHNLMRE